MNSQAADESFQPIHTLLFTSSAQFRLRSGGDLNLEAVLDPMSGIAGFENQTPAGSIWDSYGVQSRRGFSYFQTYEPDAKVDLFSAGGDGEAVEQQRRGRGPPDAGRLQRRGSAPITMGVLDYGIVWERAIRWPASAS